MEQKAHLNIKNFNGRGEMNENFAKTFLTELRQLPLVRPQDWHPSLNAQPQVPSRSAKTTTTKLVINLNVRTLKQPPRKFSTSTKDTILELKQRLQSTYNLAATDMRLVFNGRVLKDTQRVAEAGLVDNATLYVFKKEHFGEQQASNDVWGNTSQWLHQVMSASDADKVLEQFQNEYVDFLAACNDEDLKRLTANSQK